MPAVAGISVGMTRPATLISLCSVVPLATGDGVPDWIHLLPAGEIRTADGRGPYKAASLQAIAAASLTEGAKLPLDENHSIDKAAPRGEASPARGWIVELQAREDGIWGRVDWTATGRALMEDRAYAGVSPAILHTQDLRVIKLLRASLTNTPNLQGLTALHSEETSMNWKETLVAALGLASDADDATVQAAITAKLSASTSTHSEEDLLKHPVVVGLQSELTAVTSQLTAFTDGQKRKDATAFVDGAIAAGRVGVKPLRDRYIALHMKDAEEAEALINGQPILTGEVLTDAPPEDGKASVSLNATDRLIMATFGVDEETMKAELAKRGQNKGSL